MARFDVYRSRDARGLLLLQLQSDFHDRLATRIVAPLQLESKAKSEKMERLNPVIAVDGKNYILMTADLAAVPVSVLGQKLVSLKKEQHRIIAAVDFLLEGF
jgi:toxin CcdB